MFLCNCFGDVGRWGGRKGFDVCGRENIKKTGLRLKWAWLAKNRPGGEKARKGKKWGEMMGRTGA